MAVSFAEQRMWCGLESSVWHTGLGVIVGVIDSGIDSSHPLLSGKVIASFNFTDETTLLNDHGTNVAGCIANIAPGVQFIDCRVLDHDGLGNLDSVMVGVERAVDSGAKIINLSLATFPQECWENTSLSEFLDLMDLQGVTIIAAAGNDSRSGVGVWPAGARRVTAVGSVLRPVVRAGFSNRGPSCGIFYPDVSAPGVNLELASLGGRTTTGSGTSYSAPLVSGIMALAREKHPEGKFLMEYREALFRESCTTAGNPGKNNDLGWGMINATALLDAMDVIDENNIPQEEDVPVNEQKNYAPTIILVAITAGLILATRKR